MKKSVFKKLFDLMISGAFIKVLGFVFRIYLSRVSGAEGCGLYQLVLSVYALGASISSFGISQTMARLVALNEKYSKRILRTALIFTGAVSFIVCFTVFFQSEYIALNILKDSRVVKSLKVISLCFPMIALFSCVGGYFNGLLKVRYVAKGQIIEQITRIAFVFLFAGAALKNGMENGIFVMSLGIVVGEYISAAYIWFSYSIYAKTKKEGFISKTFLGDILKTSIPIASSGYISSFLHTLENIMLPQKLIVSGLTSKESVSLLGIVKGMAFPILFFPSLIIGAMATLTLPEMSKAQSQKNLKRVKKLSSKVLTTSFFTGVLTSVLLFMLSDGITGIIYKSTEAASTIKIMSLSLPFLYFNIIAISILNGLGKQLFTFLESACSGAAKLIFVMLFVPKIGIYGYYFGFIVSEIVGFVLNFMLIFNTIIAKRVNKL